MFYFLASLFALTLLLSLVLLLGVLCRPLIWRKNISAIKVFCATWYIPYFIFFFFFTGPTDLTIYPSQESSPYRLPWKAGISRFVSQGNRSFTSHRAEHLYAWDFVMPLGAEIVAARDGKVIKIEQSFSGVGLNSNFIWIKHEDGQISNYGHIQKNGALVKEGDDVQSGQPIALNGMVGETSLPHVHFVVFNSDGTQSIPISFNDVPGGVPHAGHFYRSENDRKPNFQTLFHDRDGCFIMKQLSTGRIVKSYNSNRCAQRFSPNSTFKIPAALMAFENGIFETADQLIKWDGKKYSRKEENQDQTPFSWMDQSVVWPTQVIMRKMIDKKRRKYLDEFKYGNQDFSGGVTTAWLDSSLKISADEQIAFLTRFWQETLPLSKSTFENTKKILFIKKLNSTAELYGKTGTSCAIEGCEVKIGRRRGWFVGIVKTPADNYVFAANAEDLKPRPGYAGPRLRKDVTEAFGHMNLK
ncbi:MAG: peptidoglycan DD-metalloendopeptidase family protein [Deltaproteobacteria bacterium]|nr:peptidoglycan DD-metalloendopeptidase family protein [Deltaproteobacteria bacterium]